MNIFLREVLLFLPLNIQLALGLIGSPGLKFEEWKRNEPREGRERKFQLGEQKEKDGDR